MKGFPKLYGSVAQRDWLHFAAVTQRLFLRLGIGKLSMSEIICVDSSIWIDHFRGTTNKLQKLLESYPSKIATHELIILELALGGMVNKDEKLNLISNLYRLPVVTSDELLAMIKIHSLAGKGIGCVDSHILASCLMTGSLLWTNDHKLAELADRLHVLFVS
jgi:predicted nucleic acid-binding protein